MKIKLLKNCVNPIDVSVGSARTCYSVKLKDPDSIKNWDKKYNLVNDLFKSGHHTTLQHSNFTFLMEGISRLAIWRFFHSHRFYNSDQVSQRYTEVKESSFIDFENKEILEYHKSLMSKYNDLCIILEPLYLNSSNKREQKIAKKKAMENARYILPQSVLANMYHTVNLSTLLRYYVGSEFIADCSEEVTLIVKEMVSRVLEEYPDLEDLFIVAKKSFKLKDFNLYENIDSFKEFYNSSDITKLIDSSSFTNCSNYGLGGDTVGLSALFNSGLGTESFKFKLKLSLSADAQNQRHRTAYSIRPSLSELISDKHGVSFEYYIPEIFSQSEEAMEIYSEAIYESKIIIEKYPKLSPYFLINGFMIPIVEVNSASDFIHKSEKRLCLNSQEEITKMTWSMVLKLIDNDSTKKYGLSLAPPCVHRFKNSITPICPEGDRFCGIKEWKNEKYKN